MHLYKREKFITIKNTFIACLVFIVIVVFCSITTGKVDNNLDKQEINTLKNAIENAIVTCYSIEGVYPESIDYIIDNYGVVIDKKKFSVNYSIFATNVRPRVEIIKN